jgi:two-component system, OmpR family, phosphate regulon sensor histidine kinase PhoR
MEEARAYAELRAGFTAAVSHELRTPLARLLALLESASLPNADTTGLIEQARGEVEAMTELVDDVLFLSELESGREVVALGSTPARPVLEDVRERLADSADRSDVSLLLECEEDVELPLRRRMLQIVVENLVANAIRYAGPGATLTISARRGVLEAADDGHGVEEDELPRLFERFYRGDRARASRGTGLGLAIVKHVITAAGGHVEAFGGPNHGLHVVCRLPTNGPGQASGSTPSPRPSAAARRAASARPPDPS